MTGWVVDRLGPDVPMHFTAFHPDFKMTDVPPTPPATLTRARAIARRNGVHHAYTGNVHDVDGGIHHVLGLRDPGDRARLVRDRRVRGDRRRSLRRVRHEGAGPLRRSRRQLGFSTRPGADARPAERGR